MSQQTSKEKVLECLKKNCLLPGTSLTESGQSFSIHKKGSEQVRFFHLDKKGDQGSCRECLGIGSNGRVCDLLVEINSPKHPYVYIFVELKAGKSGGDAIKQIRDTYKSAQRKTQCGSGQVFGLIVCKGSSPTGDGRKARKRGAEIKIVSRKLQPGISVNELMKLFNL